jgi:hypothetical protein
MSRQFPSLRVLAEGVVIVGSILLAFGIDAWWEGRQERQAERVYVARIIAARDSGTHHRERRAL